MEVIIEFFVGQFDVIVGIEVCGFIFVSVVVIVVGVGLILICKVGKLFWFVVFVDYVFEYGIVMIEMYDDLLVGFCVLFIDDVFVIGGILVVGCQFVECFGSYVVGILVFFEIDGFGGCEVVGDFYIVFYFV